MTPGTNARTICDYPDTTLGETVTVVRYDNTQNAYLVRSCNRLDEIWIPVNVLSPAHPAGSQHHNRKPWSFRFRKPSINASNECNGGNSVSCPEFRERLQDVRATGGTRVTLRCRVKQLITGNGNYAQIDWRKTEPDPSVMRNSGRFAMAQSEDGIATLTINNTRPSDSGTYLCILSNDIGTTQCSAILTITDTLPVLKQPAIQVISSTSVLLEWEQSLELSQQTPQRFIVEYCKFGSGEWTPDNSNSPVNALSYTVENLLAGESYSFRVRSIDNEQVSLPSYTLTLPVADNLRWQQEQFKRRYIELEEIDRGRFSVVRRAQDRGTGLEVALKQVFRRKQSHKITQAEYTLLAGMQHRNIIHAMALFDNAPLPGIDTIVLEMVKGPPLFNYIAQSEEYTEEDVCTYSRQFIAALSWLHSKNWSHLDIKPENIMIDPSPSPPLIKLIDFGSSSSSLSPITSSILPPACLEFSAPEVLLGHPQGPPTDHWSVGVVLYVLLSGVSPFLDDSPEETTANILQGDYCFPADYFSGVSEAGKSLVGGLLRLGTEDRVDMEGCLSGEWLSKNNGLNIIPSSRLRTFIQRRHPMTSPLTPTIPSSPSIFSE